MGASSTAFRHNLPAGQTVQKGIVAGSLSDSNPYWKCKDDMGAIFPFLSDSDTGGTTGAAVRRSRTLVCSTMLPLALEARRSFTSIRIQVPSILTLR